MNNPIQPAVEIELGGESHLLRFDLEAIAKAEDLTDRPLLTGLRNRDIAMPSINLVRAMLYACLLPDYVFDEDHPPLTYDMVKQWVTRKTIPDIWGKVLETWQEGMAEPEKADPTKDQN